MKNLKKKINFELWKRVHTLPKFFVEHWQLRKLKQLIRIAYSHVPVYRKLWDEIGVCPNGIRTLEDIRKLPITSKRIFRKYPTNEWINDAILPERCEWVTTSGSTGEPLRFPTPVTDPGSISSVFYNYRFLFWRGIKLGYLLKHLRAVYIVGNPTAKTKGLILNNLLLRDDPDFLFRQLKEFSPHVLEGRPTEILRLAQLAQSVYRDYMIRIPYICFQGEAHTLSARRFVEEAFGGEVYDVYGLREVGAVGVECRMHSGLHINEESFVTEIVDENGNVLPPGLEGQIVLTRLYDAFTNVSLPFIRYATGDRGILVGEYCPCGLRSRRLIIGGREGGYLDLSGKKFNFNEFSVFFNNFSSILLQYQVAKITEKNLELRIIPAREYTPQSEAMLHSGFQKKFGLAPVIKLVDVLPWTPAGKTPFVVDESGSGIS